LSPPEITHEECRAAVDVLARVGDKWTARVVGRLGGGPMRFNELRRSIPGISQRMLTLTLRALERDGIVVRTVFDTVPPAVEYALTDLGRSLAEPVDRLGSWAIANRGRIAAARRRYDEGGAASEGEAAADADEAGRPAPVERAVSDRAPATALRRSG